MRLDRIGAVIALVASLLLPCLVRAQTSEQISNGVDRLAKSLEVHGFVSQGWLRSTDNNWLAKTDNGTFDFSEFGISFSGNVNDDIRVGLQLLSRRLGDLEQDGVQIDWAYADYYFNEHFGWQVGRTKTPVGLYGDTRDFDSVRTFIFLPQDCYSEINRQQTLATDGALFYGSFASDSFGDLSYSSWVGTWELDPDSGDARSTEDGAFNFYDITEVDSDYALGTRLLWETPVSGLVLTGTLMRVDDVRIAGQTTLRYEMLEGLPTGSPVSLDLPRLDITKFGCEYTWQNLVLATEYTSLRSKAVVKVPGRPERHPAFYREGYYVSATYQMTNNLSLGTYYSARYNNASDKDGSDLERDPNFPRAAWEGWQKDTALAIRYDFRENWSLKAEYHWIDGTALVLPSENPDGLTRRWEMLALKVTYTF